ncbi:hypothetical protein [Vagococcus fluvialis]|uniref:hypothetical protein n=1 Tax=Vagococcus fluvialis TaxID=2738 RepID=UPI001D0A4CEF|nr:hypothetical protein [Vagococcus fluvialis]UDM74058.1 hypothetical protein K5K99_00010 [Vagococcus fluvialis]
MDYKEAYTTIKKFVEENEFKRIGQTKEMSEDMDAELKENYKIINGLPLGHKE